MRHRRRPPSTVHDRKPSNRDRRPGGVKAQRDGYPALILGQAAATKTLAEIAALEPVSVEDLPEMRNVSAQNIGYTVRRLVAVGLVRRYQSLEHPRRRVLMLNRQLPWADELRALLRAIGGGGLELPAVPVLNLPESRAVVERPNVTGLKVFGRANGDVETSLGTPNRTAAVLTVARLAMADASTIARVCKVQTDGDMHRLLDPIEADGVFTSKMIGSIRIYSLAPGPWAAPLEHFGRAILERHPLLASRVSSGRRMVVTGGFSNRIHLRRVLGYE